MPKCIVIAGLVLAGLTGFSGAAPAQDRNLGVCLSFKGHVYEACFAYIVNDSVLSLRQYYEDAHNPLAAASAVQGLKYRYRGSALSLIQKRAANWPVGSNVVPAPTIVILQATASLQTNTAQLTTRETWRVFNQSGRKLLFAETDRLHRIIMKRVPGYLLHIWVVTSID